MPAAAVADADQLRAQLAELVEGVREHVDADMCALPALCPGTEVARVLVGLSAGRRGELLAAALAELAALGYGLPIHLTDAALSALHVPGEGDDDDNG
jgi:hypothetical protein